MATEVSYATREMVKLELGAAAVARANTRIDRKLRAASRSVERLTLRRFYPVTATKSYPWPAPTYARSWRLLFEQPDQLISLTSATSGGTSLSTSMLNLEPVNEGPPYSYVELDTDASSAFSSSSTSRRAITFTGEWGYDANWASAGALAEALDSSETAIDVNGAAAAALGVGSVIKIDDEKMLVTERAMLTTGQTLLTTALTDVQSSVTVNVTTGSAFSVGEVIMLDSERMIIEEISGNALTVTRQYDGSVLAAHSIGTTIYAQRTLTVERGALGSTAASHSDTTAISRQIIPSLIEELTIAEACNELLQGAAAWGRTVGTGENVREFRGAGLADLRKQVRQRYGRQIRTGAI